MRKILFRAKAIKSGELVHGDLIHGVGNKEGRMYILPRVTIYPPGCHSLDGWEVDPETVGQFTGLTDKNGVKIFEGDIFSVNKGQLMLIKYIPVYLGFCRANVSELKNRTTLWCPITITGWNEFKHKTLVIGNIYDNLHLLNM